VPELTVLYDEGCGFCTRVARRLDGRGRIVSAPIGSPTGSSLLRDLPHPDRYASAHVVDANGRRWSGGAALPPLLRELPAGSLAAAACEAFPALTQRAYELVVRHRALVATLTRL
jgi:predicted DCC family thiol-disulfide oxidoreductase YuxK